LVGSAGLGASVGFGAWDGAGMVVIAGAQAERINKKSASQKKFTISRREVFILIDLYSIP
jgi:hypothetical protein